MNGDRSIRRQVQNNLHIYDACRQIFNAELH